MKTGYEGQQEPQALKPLLSATSVTTQSSLVVVTVAAGGRRLLASAEVDAQVASFAHASSVELAISVLAVSGQLDPALLVVAVLAHAA